MLERITSNRDHLFMPSGEDLFPVKNRYTAGVAGQRFFTALKEAGTILGTPCKSCGIMYVPGRLFCERCLARLEEWVDMGDWGRLFAYTVAYVDQMKRRRSRPVLLGAIQIGDGLLIHFLLDCKEQDLLPGKRFAAVLRPVEERSGSLRDILGFVPKD